MLLHEQEITREDIDRGYVLFGDRRIWVLHATPGDIIRWSTTDVNAIHKAMKEKDDAAQTTGVGTGRPN